MNRRSFILSGAAGIALFGTGVAAQRGSASSSVIVSEVTGAEIDFTESGFTLEHQELEFFFGADGIAYDHEHIHFLSEKGKLEMELLASGAYDWKRDMADLTDSYKKEYTVQEHVYTDVADGGYTVLSFDTTAVYIEYQIGSFPDVDMRIILWTEQQAFQDDLARAQTILVGGAAPFMYMAESQAADVVFASGSARSGSTRTTRSTTSQSSNTTPTNSSETTPSANTGSISNTTTGTDSAAEDEYVGIIVAHRDTFLTSYGQFMGNLDILAADTATEAEKSDLFAQMYDIALEWKAYPSDAMAPGVPSSLTELSALYVMWALTIGDMGTLFEQLYNGADTTDAFIAAVGEWEQLDAELAAALGAYGFREFKRSTAAISTIRDGLRAAWASLH